MRYRPKTPSGPLGKPLAPALNCLQRCFAARIHLRASSLSSRGPSGAGSSEAKIVGHGSASETSPCRIGGMPECLRMCETELTKSRLGRWPLAPSAGERACSVRNGSLPSQSQLSAHRKTVRRARRNGMDNRHSAQPRSAQSSTLAVRLGDLIRVRGGVFSHRSDTLCAPNTHSLDRSHGKSPATQ